MPSFALTLTAKSDDQESSSYVAQSNREGDLSCQVCVKAVYMRTQCCFPAQSNIGALRRALGTLAGTLALPTALRRILLNSLHDLLFELFVSEKHTSNGLFDGWCMLVNNCKCEMLTAEFSGKWSTRNSKSSIAF